MGSKGPDSHTVTQESGPPEWVVPYLRRTMKEAKNLYKNQPLYPDTALPDEALSGFAAGQGVAADPALIDPSVQLAQSTIGGDFLNADALRNAARAELDDVVGGTLGSFEGAGRGQSGLANYALGRGVTAALGQEYGRERGLQQQAMGMAPGLEASRYGPGQQAVNLAMQQRGIEEKYYQEPWQRLQQYAGLIQGSAPLAGQVGSTTQPVYQPSMFSQLAGLGLAGTGAAAGLGWRPLS